MDRWISPQRNAAALSQRGRADGEKDDVEGWRDERRFETSLPKRHSAQILVGGLAYSLSGDGCEAA